MRGEHALPATVIPLPGRSAHVGAVRVSRKTTMLPRVAGISALLIAVLSAAVMARTRPTTLPADESHRIFGIDRLWTVHLRITPEHWKQMQPTRACRLAYMLGVVRQESPTTQPAPATMPAADGADDGSVLERRVTISPFGYEYTYVPATVEMDGEVYRNVGVRFKGNSSYSYYASGLKRPMKLDFDRFVPGQHFFGLFTINLQNNALDPSELREALSYLLFRDAGVPAPRTALAMVYLTVDGLYDRQFVGLYTMIEEVDRAFLRRHFGNDAGLLLKPEGTRNLAYLGQEWENYRRFNPKTPATPETAQRFMEFTRLIHHADDETFVSTIGSYLAVDEFLRFIAVNAILINMDSFLSGGHNFYVYVNPADNLIYFMPWDLNFSFGSGGKSGAEAAAMSIYQPFPSTNRLLERVMAIYHYRAAYEYYLKRLADGWFSVQRMYGLLDRLEPIVQRAETLLRQTAATRPAATMPATAPAVTITRTRPELRAFIADRVASVTGQLAGQAVGWVPGERPPPKPVWPPAVPPKPAVVARPAPPPKPPGGAIAKPPTTLPAKPAAVAAKPVKPPAPPPPVAVAKPVVKPPHPAAAVMIRNLDADRDGLLARHEMLDAVRLFFHAAGRPEGGAVSEELLADTLDRIDELLDLNPAPKPAAEMAAGSAVRDRPSMMWARALLKAADVGEGEGITLSEALALMERLFIEADANNDGLLTQKELSDALDRLVPR